MSAARPPAAVEKIQKYLGITLLPQAGVALGMAAEAAELSDGHMVRNVVLSRCWCTAGRPDPRQDQPDRRRRSYPRAARHHTADEPEEPVSI